MLIHCEDCPVSYITLWPLAAVWTTACATIPSCGNLLLEIFAPLTPQGKSPPVVIQSGFVR